MSGWLSTKPVTVKVLVGYAAVDDKGKLYHRVQKSEGAAKRFKTQSNGRATQVLPVYVEVPV